MKKSRNIALGLVVTMSLGLSGCGFFDDDDDDDSERYNRGSHAGIIYNHLGRPFQLGANNTVTPLPESHPMYNAAVSEGQALARGTASPSGHAYVSRGGFGLSAAHVVS